MSRRILAGIFLGLFMMAAAAMVAWAGKLQSQGQPVSANQLGG